MGEGGVRSSSGMLRLCIVYSGCDLQLGRCPPESPISVSNGPGDFLSAQSLESAHISPRLFPCCVTLGVIPPGSLISI